MPGGVLIGVAPRAGLPVEDVLQDLAGLERQDPAGADRDLLAGLRVPPRARVLVAHDEVPEAGDLDLLASLEGLLDRVEDGLDDLGGLLLRESANLLVDVLNDVGLRHDRLLLYHRSGCAEKYRNY